MRILGAISILVFAVPGSCSCIVGACLYNESEKRAFEKLREKSELNCGTMPLHCAISKGNEVDIARALNKPGALRAADGWGRTALQWCLRYSASGACASPRGKIRTASRLIAAGANVNARDEEGQTVLFQAVIAGQFEIASLMLKHGADINGVNGGQPPMPQLCNLFWLRGRHAKSRNLAALRFLMQNGARMTPECGRRVGVDTREDYLSREYRRLRAKGAK